MRMLNPTIDNPRTILAVFAASLPPFLLVAFVVQMSDPRPLLGVLLASIAAGLVAAFLPIYGWRVRALLGLEPKRRRLPFVVCVLVLNLAVTAVFWVVQVRFGTRTATTWRMPLWAWRMYWLTLAGTWGSTFGLSNPPEAVRAVLGLELVSSDLVVLPGTRIRAVLRFAYSQKTVERVFDPVLADLQHEWMAATLADHPWHARWIRVRGYAQLAQHLGLKSLWSFGKAIAAVFGAH